MIFRVNLPHEDDFLDTDGNDRGDLNKTPYIPGKLQPCGCSWCVMNTWAMVLSGVFTWNNA